MWNLGSLCFYKSLGKLNDFICRENVLETPSPAIWEDTLHNADHVLEIISNALPENQRSDFLAVCLASFLLDQKAIPAKAKSWLMDKVNPSDLGLPFSWQAILKWRWKLLPVVLANQNKARIVNFLLGAGFEEPSKSIACPSQSCMDKQALFSMQKILENAAWHYETYLFCSPLCSTFDYCTIYGSSLELPLWLGLSSTVYNYPLPNLLATGRLDSGGDVLEVGRIKEKLLKAREYGFKGLLCPTSARIPEISDMQGIEILPVNDIHIALALWQHYTPGKGQRLINIINFLSNGQFSDFFRQLPECPPSLLPWLKKHCFALSRALREETEDTEALKLFVNRIKQSVQKSGHCQELLDFFSTLLNKEFLHLIKDKDPDLAWTICNFQIELNNHKGNVCKSRTWQELAASLKPEIMRNEKGSKQIILHDISKMINNYHNRYEFRPDIIRHCDHFFLEEINEFLNSYEQRQTKGLKPVWDTVGRYYGTIAQNYGFCGPQYLEQVKQYSKKAITAFGGLNGRNDLECRRDLSYLVFAHLDCKNLKQAETALLNCLQIKDINEFQFSTNLFHLFIWIRFLADSGKKATDELLSLALTKAWSLSMEHPAQLILYNLARIIQNPKEKRDLLYHSIDYCLSIGSTTKPMALLPLSLLWSADLVSASYIESTINKALKPIYNKELFIEHFNSLVHCAHAQEVLELILKKKNQFFPFSYR